MRIFPARYATAFLISGDVFDNIGGDALIDKISDLYLLQTEAAKKTLDYQVAGSKNGAIAVVLSAVTGANGTVTCATLRTDGGTFGSYKVKDGARIHFVNGTTNVARGAPTTGVVVDPGGNNRATSVITFDTVPAGTTAGDYLTYEGSALKAPHGLTDLINNDTGEIQGQLRSNRPYLKSIVLNATTQRLQVALLVEVHFSLRYRTENPGNTLILSSPTQKAKQFGPSDGDIGNDNGVNCWEPKPFGGHGNQQRSASNGLRVDANAQRLGLEEANPIRAHERPAAWFQADNIVWPAWKHVEAGGNILSILPEERKKSNNAAYMSNGFVKEARQIVMSGCNRVNSGKAYSGSHGDPEPSLSNGVKVDRKVQRLGQRSQSGNAHQRPALASLQAEEIVRSAWKHAANTKDNLQRFDGGGGSLRMDFTDVKFGEGITWDTHVAIDPDRCYGVNPADINVYELMKFGAYARDTLQMRQYTSGGTYYDQWIGFLGCKYDLGATRFGSHWLLSNLDITGLPAPSIAFA